MVRGKLHSALKVLQNRSEVAKVAALKTIKPLNKKRAPRKSDTQAIVKRYNTNPKGIYTDLIKGNFLIMEPTTDLTHGCYQKGFKFIVSKDAPKPSKPQTYR